MYNHQLQIYFHAYIPLIHKCVRMKKECGISHKYKNVQNFDCKILWTCHIVLWIIFTHKKFIYRVKVPTIIHWVGGWVGPGADLGISKDKTFPLNLNLLQQSVSEHVKCIVCWLAAFEVSDLPYLVRSQTYPQTFSSIRKNLCGWFWSCQ